jgi:dCMP deaminase
MDKWDYAHMEVARIYSQLSSAKRLQVGAVIVKDKRVLSIGYNGMPTKWTNECEFTDEHGLNIYTKPEVLHAETNAIAKVAKSSESCDGATIYSTTAPCLDCAKLIYQSGIKRVVWNTPHLRSDDGIQFLQKCEGVTVEYLE